MLSFLLPLAALAFEPYLPFVKFDPRSANGDCLAPLAEPPAAVLRRNRVLATDPAAPEVARALAHVIGSLERLGDGRFSAFRDVEYLFGREESYSWHQSGTHLIHLNPGRQNLHAVRDKRFGGTNNEGVLAHELGHYVAFRDGFAVKRLYEASVPTPCHLSTYSESNDNGYRNEEFGEVFSAFLTSPGLLAGRSAACDRARAFLAAQFGEPLARSSSCAARRGSLLRPY